MRKLISTFITILFFSCSTKENSEDEIQVTREINTVSLTKEQFNNCDLGFSLPIRDALLKTISVNGYVDVPPQSLVSVCFPLGGYLKSSNLLPGMKVKKGQVLAILEDISFVQLQQDYLVEKSKLEFLELDIKRQKELNKDKINSDKILEKSFSEYKSQLAMVKGLSEKLRLIGIDSEKLSYETLSRSVQLFSPIDGWVSKVNVNVGKYVNPSDVLFELVNPEDIHAALTVFEQDCRRLEIGQKVKLKLLNRSEEVSASVILFNKNLDENKSVLVHCHFDQPQPEILPGMFLSGNIQVKSDTSLVLPTSALVIREGKRGVFVKISELSYKFIPLEIDFESKGMIQLSISTETEKLKNSEIVSRNAFKLMGALELEKE